MIVSEVKEVYIIECDKEWVECLEKTFREYKDKVHIVEGLIGREGITFDEYFKNIDYSFIKADIEGYERDLITGAEKTIRKNRPAMAICCYHKIDDFVVIEKLVDKITANHRPSDGYMLYEQWDEELFREPYLRKGLLFVNEN